MHHLMRGKNEVKKTEAEDNLKALQNYTPKVETIAFRNSICSTP